MILLLSLVTYIDQDVNEKLRVCDICGAFLSIYDSDKYPPALLLSACDMYRRLIDHFAGKQHLGYQVIHISHFFNYANASQLIRDKLIEIQKRRKEEQSKQSTIRYKDATSNITKIMLL